MAMNATELRTITDRVEAHLDDIEGRASLRDPRQFALRAGQIGLGRDTVQAWREPNRRDGGLNDRIYFVRPTGTGKTVSLITLIVGANTLPSGRSVLGDKSRGKQAVVMVPQNFLLTQWENELLGEPNAAGGRNTSKWGERIRPEHVGIYRATDTFEQKCEALRKQIVVITYDSARIICDGPRNQEELSGLRREQYQGLRQLLNPSRFSLAILDEIHDRPRGDVTGDFIRRNFFGNCAAIGATATHLYKSGRTIGDYLLDGEIPFHETTFREAVNRSEICPMRNIIADVQLAPEQQAQLREITEAALERARRQGHSEEELDYTERELERIVEISKRDEAAIRLLQRGFDPDTGKRYRDMKQVWYCASVKHAENLANRLNEMMGENYAVAVYGNMGGQEQSGILINYRQGNHRALTNCQLLTLGFDDPEAELCLQIAPTRSPIRSMQQGGRVMRIDPNNPRKIANIVTFVYPGLQQVIFGELAQGMIMIPPGFEYGPTTGGRPPAGPTRAWPEIEGLRVYYTTEQLTLFAEDRRRQRYINGLPVKTDNMLTVEEMARELFPRVGKEQLNREIARLQRRIYEPLQAAYDMRQARQQFVGVDDTTDRGREEPTLAVRGQRFPVWRIGHYNHNKKARFCIDRNAAALCRFGMYGRVGNRTPDLLSETQARRLLGLNEEQWNNIADRVKEAYLDRRGYERDLNIDNVNIPVEHIGFYRAQDTINPSHSQIEFFLQPDALLPLHRLASGADRAAATEWWDRHPQLPRLKTTEWLNQADTVEALGLNALDPRMEQFDQLWQEIDRGHRRTGASVPLGQEKRVRINVNATATDEIRTAMKITLADNTQHVCVNRDSLDMLRYRLGMESAYEPPEQDRRRGGHRR